MGDQQLDLLMTYTTFHIGLYASLITALLSFLTFSSRPTKGLYRTMAATLVCFFLAGVFGGIIGSSIPRYKTYDEFSTVNLSPKWLEGRLEGRIGGQFETLAAIEHMFFWAGITIAMTGVLWYSRPKK